MAKWQGRSSTVGSAARLYGDMAGLASMVGSAGHLSGMSSLVSTPPWPVTAPAQCCPYYHSEEPPSLSPIWNREISCVPCSGCSGKEAKSLSALSPAPLPAAKAAPGIEGTYYQ
ncbi:hypothetical protein BS78_07G125200 [Paspalum vaginatum]|nr:hypothetical protein BS78_07G125200 [Paspalum vaginatum]KAJ1268313.1 hypothetical protein BS78_07G125200 [Paspalum vaginatum]